MKQNKMKKLLLCLVMVFVCSIGYAQQAKAEDVVPLNKEQEVELGGSEYIMRTIVIPADGILTISGYETGSDDGIEISLIDRNNSVIRTVSTYDSWDVAYSRAYGVAKGSKYYIKVSKKITWDDLANMHYTVKFTPNNYYEKEYNNSAATANAIKPSKTYKGNLTNRYDEDYYKIKLNSASTLSLNFGPETVDGEDHPWYVYLLNSKGQSVYIYGSSTTQTYTTNLKKGTYYLKVCGNYNYTGNNYKLSYKTKKLKVTKPTISSVKAKGHHVAKKNWWGDVIGYDNYVTLNKIKISMKSKCEGYEVRVARKSNMKQRLMKEEIAVTRKNSVKIDKTFKVYKKYYMKLRGYVTTPFGEKIYGDYSKVKTVSLSAKDYKKCK